jgi:phage terminase small subunit
MPKNLDERWQLTPLQMKFCEEYTISYRGGLAAAAAGYTGTERTLGATASTLLKKANIKAYITHLEAGRQIDSIIDTQRILTEYARIGFSNITNVLKFNSSEVKLYDSADLTPDVTASIKEVTCTTTTSPDGYTKTSVKLILYDKTKALKDLAQYLGMFNDFNNAITCLEKYGLSVYQDDNGKWNVMDKQGNRNKTEYAEISKAILADAGLEVNYDKSSEDS